ncbi:MULTISPECIES: hypothetical protein [Aeromonas]|uniref:Uncharacterized protein n=3 Tax=Aeromonas caviae TaxID=648 RepID=A0AAF0K5A2_AERCA|nr:MULTISPECIES: hypothetical protein [Aeromonas]MDU7312292.1 hypothetical protein [Aeromonas sp.]MCK2071906.1 hypothetical protein [Aeromonas caviae]MCU7795032.1 hypothetical protein [Aeromonas caviae]MCV3281726.1 hypothetical protein [Aeromonas caviae]MDH0308580.1 hypothetical protein [Aeromonas caviae]
MALVVYQLPFYAGNIIDKMIENDWFVHSFTLGNVRDIYNPSAYLYNLEFNNVEYTIHLDLNIYQYVLNAVKKDKKQPLHRNAIALMVFAKFTNIILDPTIAIYEKLNYRNQCPDELIDDLILFRQIDNADMDVLAQFALGNTDTIELPEPRSLERSHLKYRLVEYQRLKKWDTIYLLVLKVTELFYYRKDTTGEEKLKYFWQWCHHDFLFSLVVTCFAIKLFGKKPIPKLMKYTPEQSAKINKQGLINMTWDLFLLDKFFEHWQKKPSNKEFLYASNDKPLQEVLKIAIEIQKKGHNIYLRDLSSELNSYFTSTFKKIMTQEGRRITSVTDFKSFRDDMISNYETILLINE